MTDQTKTGSPVTGTLKLTKAHVKVTQEGSSFETTVEQAELNLAVHNPEALNTMDLPEELVDWVKSKAMEDGEYPSANARRAGLEHPAIYVDLKRVFKDYVINGNTNLLNADLGGMVPFLIAYGGLDFDEAELLHTEKTLTSNTINRLAKELFEVDGDVSKGGG